MPPDWPPSSARWPSSPRSSRSAPGSLRWRPRGWRRTCSDAQLREDRPEPVLEADLSLPAEPFAGARDLEAAPLHLAGPPWSELGVEPVAETTNARQRAEDVDDGDLAARPDVHGPGEIGVGGGQIGSDHVAHLDPVTRLATVAEHGRSVAAHEPPGEDRDHAGLAVDVLTGAVHVAVSHGDRGEPVQPRVQLAVALGGVFALAVRSQRADRVVLGGRDQ